MQEDKESVFDGVETVQKCLSIFAPMLDTMTVKKEKMREAACRGFINATDLADYLTKKGMPFRSAYKIVGGIVASCIASGNTLETLSLESYRTYSELFEDDLFHEISLDTCVKKRISAGSTGPDSVAAQIEYVKNFLANA
jgi:argininosuccinate lyase